MTRAVFLDRDGTVIEWVHHLTDPADVKLVPGAADAIRLFRSAGYACVVVTNQSVIGRGMLVADDVERIHEEMRSQLAANGAELDCIYYCPVVPGTSDPTIIEHRDRKPGPGMLLRAAEEMDIELGRSWMIGDSISDVLAGRNAGCKGSILVESGSESGISSKTSIDDYITSRNLLGAAELIVGQNT